MTSREFAYWLQGFFELREDKNAPLTVEQSKTIQKHLAMVFIHEIDPSAPAEQQAALNYAHSADELPANFGKLPGLIPRC